MGHPVCELRNLWSASLCLSIKDFIFSIFEPYAGLLQKCETWCGLERWDEVRVLARVQLVHGQLEEYVGSAVRSAGDRAAGAQSIDLIETQMLTRYIAFTPTRGRWFAPHLGHLVIPPVKKTAISCLVTYNSHLLKWSSRFVMAGSDTKMNGDNLDTIIPTSNDVCISILALSYLTLNKRTFR